jgi:hypothetical protein
MKLYRAKGSKASRLRQRKHELVRQYDIPENALPGSLVLKHRRCGKPTCHCATGKGHPMWSLNFMANGKANTERIPFEWVKEVQPLHQQGREYKNAVAEVFAINAQLLTLMRQQHQAQKKKKKKPRKPRKP